MLRPLKRYGNILYLRWYRIPSRLFWVQNGLWRIFGGWDISHKILGKFGKIKNFQLFPKIMAVDLNWSSKKAKIIEQKTPCFERAVRTPKISFIVSQIILRVLQVPIFRNQFCFGGKALTFWVQALFKNVDVHQGQTSNNFKCCIIKQLKSMIMYSNIKTVCYQNYKYSYIFFYQKSYIRIWISFIQLELNFALIFCRFGFSWFCLVE